MAAVISVTGQQSVRLGEGWQLALMASGAASGPEALPPALDWIAAQVPGTAAQALSAAGRWTIEQPASLHDQDIWYRTRFAGSGRRTLRFLGLATIAEVWLNGVPILASDNMFLAHAIAVDLAGDNELVLVFRSLDRGMAARKGRARWRTKLVEDNALRKVRTTLLGHMTGWQPPVHAVGPWRAIELIDEAEGSRVQAADLRATLEGDDGLLSVALDLDWQGERPSPTLEVGDVTGPLSWTGVDRVAGTLRLPKVEKWWPHTHGSPALHDVRVHIGPCVIDLGRTGFRSIELDRDTDGKGFALRINGQKIFARGACWSATDLVSLASDRTALRPWLERARDAHMNMLRVGGTMTYESDDFFALCDELGILVWHDFMFANMDYPIGDAAFRASVETEAAQFLGRTQGHPALAVLCGGSEVAQQAAMLGLPRASWSSPLFDEILPAAAAALRPDAIYLPHSPGGGDLPFSTDHGVSHYYGVGAYLRPIEDARRAGVRFTSECLAFANVPDAASPGVPWDDPVQRKAAVPRDRGTAWDFEDVRDHYLRLIYGEDAQRLRERDPIRYLRLSRAVIAQVIEATIAEWRRPGSSCWGALVWMLKDFMPGPSWGVVDSAGLPKSAWHALRRAFCPVQVAITDEGLNGLGIHLLNETARSIPAELSLICFQDGRIETVRRKRTVELPARSALTLSSTELIGHFLDTTYAYRFGPTVLDTIVVLDDTTGVRLSECAHFPLGRMATQAEPVLVAELAEDREGWTLTVGTSGLARSVQIEDEHFQADDGCFHLLPGEQRTVRLTCVAGGPFLPRGVVLSGDGGNAVRYQAKGCT